MYWLCVSCVCTGQTVRGPLEETPLASWGLRGLNGAFSKSRCGGSRGKADLYKSRCCGDEDGRVQQQILGRPVCTQFQDRFFKNLPRLVDKKTGICGWVPVDFVDQSGVFRELVSMSIPMIWVYTKQGLDAAEIRSSISSPSNFPRYPGRLRRADFSKVIIKTPFRPYAVGKVDTPNSMLKTRSASCSWGWGLDECTDRSRGLYACRCQR